MKISVGIPTEIRDIQSQIEMVLGTRLGAFMNASITGIILNMGANEDREGAPGSFSMHWPHGLHVAGRCESVNQNGYGRMASVTDLNLRVRVGSKLVETLALSLALSEHCWTHDGQHYLELDGKTFRELYQIARGSMVRVPRIRKPASN